MLLCSICLEGELLDREVLALCVLGVLRCDVVVKLILLPRIYNYLGDSQWNMHSVTP